MTENIEFQQVIVNGMEVEMSCLPARIQIIRRKLDGCEIIIFPYHPEQR